MRSLTPILLLAAATAGFGAFAGCSEGNPLTPSDSTSVTTVGTTGSGLSPCNFGAPDGRCNPGGQYPEDCSCSDCEATALCTQRCVEDNVCSIPQEGLGEDCSCPDCYLKVNGCGVDYPCDDSGNCQCDDEPPATCTVSDSCVCTECKDVAGCNTCVDNGVCVPALESCNCADCMNDVVCGGQGPASSSSAASSSNVSSSASSSSTGGGAGGNGGAGGMGGAGGA